MSRRNIFIFGILTLTLFICSCGGSGSSNTTASGTTVLITASVSNGASLAVTSTYDGTTFDSPLTSYTLTSTIYAGALNPSAVTITSVDIRYTPLEYNALTHAMSPAIPAVFHLPIGGLITAGGKLELQNIPVFGPTVGAQDIPAIDTLLDGSTVLPYEATVTFNMNEDATNTPMSCTVKVGLFLQ